MIILISRGSSCVFILICALLMLMFGLFLPRGTILCLLWIALWMLSAGFVLRNLIHLLPPLTRTSPALSEPWKLQGDVKWCCKALLSRAVHCVMGRASFSVQGDAGTAPIGQITPTRSRELRLQTLQGFLLGVREVVGLTSATHCVFPIDRLVQHFVQTEAVTNPALILQTPKVRA